VNGCYAVTWDATDTDTVGELFYTVKVAGALQVFGSFTVLEEAIYDALFAASANAWSGAAGSSVVRANDSSGNALATASALDAVDNFVDTEISALITTIGVAGAGLTDLGGFSTTAKGQIQTECEEANVVHGLDHLLSTSVAGTDVANNSIVAQLVSKTGTADYDSYNHATDSLEALRDRGDAAWITATGFSTHSAADVWSAGTRTLTALDEDSTTLDLDATIRAAVGLAAANLDTQLTAIDDAVDTEVAAILAAVDTEIGAIQTTLSTLFTTALTESYRADGATGSVAQLLYEINQTIGERAFAGTTGNVKKIDGSTTAFTQTLDSASTPTSITRAT
jgi:hypothetical protein